MIAGDWIITSKQRYGKVIEVDINTMAALIKIGDKQYWISMDQLTPSKDGCLFKVTYMVVNEYDEKVQQLFIKRNTKLFDITDRTTDLYEVIKHGLIKVIGKDCRINKIEIS